MKTIKQWLEELPEPYRTQALENYENNKVQSLSFALINAFEWYDTPEGIEYWADLNKKICENNLVDKE